MKNTNLLLNLSLVSIIFFTAYSLSAQTFQHDELSIRIAKYKGDKKCAISYTFDDGLNEHYTVAAPQLEKHNFRGTFWINGAKVNDNEIQKKDTTRASWSELKKMSDAGHEISNHGWSHKRLTRLSFEDVKFEILKNDSVIFDKVGVRPVTFCYPYNAKNEEILELASINRVSTRTQQVAIGKKSTEQSLETWVNSLLTNSEWGIAMTHGIYYGYDSFSDPTVLWNHFSKVKSMEDSIWVGTYREVASYIRQRVHLNMQIDKIKNNRFIVTPDLKLDKALFSEPLTMILEKSGITKVSIIQDKKKLPTQVFSDKILFDFNPYGGPIQIDFSFLVSFNFAFDEAQIKNCAKLPNKNNLNH